jgi:hypothetical protein
VATPTPTTRLALAGDRIYKLLLDRDPLEGCDLASQPVFVCCSVASWQRHCRRGYCRRAATADQDPTSCFPGITIRVRLDGGFAHPAVLEFLEAQPKLEYVVAMAKNAVLNRTAPGIRRCPSAVGKAVERRNTSLEKSTTRITESTVDLRTAVVPTWQN